MTAAINSAYLEWRLSGGSGNTNPNASLGGAMSSERIVSQSAAGVSNITGVTMLFAAANSEGAGTLTYINSSKSFRWTPPGGSIGIAKSCAEDCRLALFGDGGIGKVDIDVDFSALPGSDQTDTITIANVLNELFDNVSESDSFNGDVEYRCYYGTVVHGTAGLLDLRLFIGTPPSPGAVAFGIDPAGVGPSITATTVANENTAPSGVTFNSVVSPETAISVGAVAASDRFAIWTRRTIPPVNTTPNDETLFLIDSVVIF